MEKGPKAFSKSNLMVTKKVRKFSGNALTGEVKLEVLLSHSSARSVTSVSNLMNRKKMEEAARNFFLAYFLWICKLVPTEEVSPSHSSVIVAVLWRQRCRLSLRPRQGATLVLLETVLQLLRACSLVGKALCSNQN